MSNQWVSPARIGSVNLPSMYSQRFLRIQYQKKIRKLQQIPIIILDNSNIIGYSDFSFGQLIGNHIIYT